jgi:hypothetical protein
VAGEAVDQSFEASQFGEITRHDLGDDCHSPS